MRKAVFLFCFIAVSASAAVFFNEYRIDASGMYGPNGLRMAAPTEDAADCWLVGLDGPVMSFHRAALSAAGVPFLVYIADNGALVRSRGGRRPDTPFIRFAVPLRPEMKLDPTLVRNTPEDNTAHLTVHLLPDGDTVRVGQALRALGGTVYATTERTTCRRLVVHVPPSDKVAFARAAAALGDVLFIERPRRKALFLNSAVPVVIAGNVSAGWPLLAHNLDGAGQVVGICDTGIDADMCWFRDASGQLPPVNRTSTTTSNPSLRKVIAADFWYASDDPQQATHWDDHGHGTAVAACIGAARLDSPHGTSVYNGPAPGCKLVVQDAGMETDDCADLPGLGCPVIDLAPLFQQAYDQGARIHNNSWGDRENFVPLNIYSAASQDVDEFTWTHKDFLLVFAAGNAGPGDGTVASPSTAKNSLSVGATLNGSSASAMASFSSRGWVNDGRYKPDVCAPGSGIVKARSDGNITTSNCGTSSGSGTSFASPLVAGCAAVVRQYFTDGYYPTGTAQVNHGFPPSAALVKAVLINSALNVDTGGDRPSRAQGWGRIALTEALYLGAGTRRLFVDDAQPGFADSNAAATHYRLEVRSSRPLKITLVWSDYPAVMGAGVHLVNDLDLVLELGEVRWLGNVWNGGRSVPGGSSDRRNNVEQILLPSPVEGTYVLRVEPYNIPHGPQDYAVVITGDVTVRPPADPAAFSLY